MSERTWLDRTSCASSSFCERLETPGSSRQTTSAAMARAAATPAHAHENCHHIRFSNRCDGIRRDISWTDAELEAPA